MLGRWQACSWLNLWGAMLFVLESALDTGWSCTTSSMLAAAGGDAQPRGSVHLSGNRHAQQQQLLDADEELVASASCSLLDRVHWDFWAALIFLVASMFYLAGVDAVAAVNMDVCSLGLIVFGLD